MNVETNNHVAQQRSNCKEYIYRHVRFIVRGPKNGRKIIDFVPCSWVYVSKLTGKLVAKFMPPPYTEESCDLLHHLIRNLCDPIREWPEYNVEIRGGAKSYEEAEKRLKELEDREYVFTTDTDETSEEKASKIVRQLKQAKLRLSAETEAALKVPELNSDNEVEEINDKDDDNRIEDRLPEETIDSAHYYLSKPKSSQSTPSTNNGTKFGSKVHDYNGNLKLKEINKNRINGKTGKSSISKTNKPTCYQFSKFQSDRSTPSGHENSDLSEESLQESVFRKTFDSRLSFDKVYTDSENEGQIEKSCTDNSVIDSSVQLSKGHDFIKLLHGKESVSIHKKPSKPKSDKTCQKTSQFSDVTKSKKNKNEDKSNPQHGDPKSKQNQEKNKSYFADDNIKSNKKKEQKSKTYKISSDSQLLWEIHEDLQKIKVDIEEIKANQRHEQETRHKAEIEQGMQENFIVKHNLELPFTDKETFNEFNLNLLGDEDFRKEFMKSLNKLFDRNVIPSRSLTNIVRKYLSSELAMQYTAIKKMPNKFLMKDTAFYDCLLGVLADTHRDKSGKFITESAFSSLLGNTLGNAKDWKGNRRRRMNRNPDLDEDSNQASGMDCD